MRMVPATGALGRSAAAYRSVPQQHGNTAALVACHWLRRPAASASHPAAITRLSPPRRQLLSWQPDLFPTPAPASGADRQSLSLSFPVCRFRRCCRQIPGLLPGRTQRYMAIHSSLFFCRVVHVFGTTLETTQQPCCARRSPHEALARPGSLVVPVDGCDCCSRTACLAAHCPSSLRPAPSAGPYRPGSCTSGSAGPASCAG